MSDNTVNMEMTTLDISWRVSGMPYQRPVDERNVKRLIDEWDLSLMDPPVVSFRDGSFNLVEGQHRVIALRRIYGDNIKVPCKIHYGLTYQQEAELCYKLDQAKKRLSAAQAVNALVESESDPDIMEIQRLVEANGFIWALDKKIPGEYEIIAVRAVINAYKLLGGASFDRMLRLMSAAWHGAPCTLKANFISGMALFLKTYETELVDRTAIKRLSPIAPEEVILRGKTDFSTNRAALRYARVLLNEYNRQRGRKLSYRLQGRG